MVAPAFQPDSRRANLQRLKEDEFDVLIVGGGINGAGIARDLGLRSQQSGTLLRVALIEQRHFASGTSGRNSQLIHGGLRYLKQFHFRLVREALRERATLLRIAPHLVEPLPFLLPFYGRIARLFYGAGLVLYDRLAGEHNIARRRFLDHAEALRIEPALRAKGLRGAAIFYDARVQATRMVLENIFDAARCGVVIANYVRATDLVPEGMQAVETFSGDRFLIRARKIVDATGPWEGRSNLRLVRGSHIVLPRINASPNAIAYFEDSGRIIFIIPWGSSGQLSLVGTTDCDHSQGPDEVHITREEVRYLLQIVRRLFPEARDFEPIAAYSSLRPLLRSGEASATKSSREYRIWHSVYGVLHVAGGKYTTFRSMSEQACDLLLRQIAQPLVGKCFTATTPLGGNTIAALDQLRASTDAPEDSLIAVYGLQALHVAAWIPFDASEIPAVDRARIAYAIYHEMVRRLPDLMFVSTYWGYEKKWSSETLRPIAEEMARYLGWDRSTIAQEVELVLGMTALPE